MTERCKINLCGYKRVFISLLPPLCACQVYRIIFFLGKVYSWEYLAKETGKVWPCVLVDNWYYVQHQWLALLCWNLAIGDVMELIWLLEGNRCLFTGTAAGPGLWVVFFFVVEMLGFWLGILINYLGIEICQPKNIWIQNGSTLWAVFPFLVLFTTFPCVVSGTVPCKSCYRGEKKVKFYVGKDKSHISADSIA